MASIVADVQRDVDPATCSKESQQAVTYDACQAEEDLNGAFAQALAAPESIAQHSHHNCAVCLTHCGIAAGKTASTITASAFWCSDEVFFGIQQIWCTQQLEGSKQKHLVKCTNAFLHDVCILHVTV